MLQIKIRVEVRKSPYQYADVSGQAELTTDIPDVPPIVQLDSALMALIVAAYGNYQEQRKDKTE